MITWKMYVVKKIVNVYNIDAFKKEDLSRILLDRCFMRDCIGHSHDIGRIPWLRATKKMQKKCTGRRLLVSQLYWDEKPLAARYILAQAKESLSASWCFS